MDKTVSSRPNHYQALGLEADASPDDIAMAYARELRAPRTIGQIALAGMAYEVLRDPAKREAYDRSIGVAKEPEAALLQWSGASPFRAAYIRTARAAPAANNAALPAASPARPQEPEPAADIQSDQRSHLAAAFRNISQAEPLRTAAAATSSEPDGRQGVVAEATNEPQSLPLDQPGPVSDEVEDVAFDWKRIGVGAGALVAVAGLFGVWAGSEVGNDNPAPPTEAASKTMLPPATPFPDGLADGQVIRPSVAAATAPAARGIGAAPAGGAIRKQPPAKAIESEVYVPTESASIEIAAADPLGPTPVQPSQELVNAAVKAASMPLPNRTIARTIERIGYACGEVAATDAVAGQAGVFTISCTSGQSFQAKPVSGRYRFKRLNR